MSLRVGMRLGWAMGAMARHGRSAYTIAARPSTTGAIKHLDRLIITSPEDAMEVATRLTHDEQILLRKALEKIAIHQGVPASPTAMLTSDQTRDLFLVNMLPFIGFGCLDNMIMILAGEYIDQKMGALFCLSTMAAAALGNLISDVAGVGLAHYIEVLVSKVGIKNPVLTHEQMESPKARLTTNSARAIGLVVGCLIGMFPLLFFNNEEKKDKKEETK